MTASGASAACKGHILVVDDDPGLCSAIEEILSTNGANVRTAYSLAEARGILAKRVPDLVLLDLTLPDGSGFELLDEIRAIDEIISVIVMTGLSDVETVVESMRRGADNFVPKPVEPALFVKIVARGLQEHRNRQHVETYRDIIATRRASAPDGMPRIIGSSRAIAQVREQAVRVAPTDASVLLRGESGTGKGMLAREIHRLSKRAAGPFVDVNCASIQPQLAESEIFGHERGAFTGAHARKPGLLEVANGGTLFLDEVADLDLQAQAKVLKALEDRTFRRVGGVRQLPVDVRIIAATHRNLEEMIDEGTFRRDLFYRLNVFPILIPPLRERLEDLDDFTGYFIATLNPLTGSSVTGVSAQARDLLLRYSWPGNVRELRNVLERAIILAGRGQITARHLPRNLADGRDAVLRPLADIEREHIVNVLRSTGGNIKRAASILGISRSTLYEKLKRYNIPAARSGSA
ncbi:MAG: sigma-54-dependent Fis family transcriptional regulator [Acidobacteria bacterium]|nr:sigma-54-dependent Fis family transcriptional regulator [Acidobacteriota bacterium]